MKRRIIGIILTLALCLTLLPTAALADEADSSAIFITTPHTPTAGLRTYIDDAGFGRGKIEYTFEYLESLDDEGKPVDPSELQAEDNHFTPNEASVGRYIKITATQESTGKFASVITGRVEIASTPKVQMYHAEVGKPVEYGIVGADENTQYQWFGVYSNDEFDDIKGRTEPTYTPTNYEVANHDYIGLKISGELPDGSKYETQDFTKLYRRAEFSSTYTEVTDEGISVVIRYDVMADNPMLIAAFYEGNKKMCSAAIYEGEIKSMEIMPDGSISGTNLIETEIPENATRAKIFLLGDNYEPLCFALEIELVRALAPKMLAPNAVVKNPYMADAENSVHNDSYSSDVTAAVLPLGIFDEMNKSLETLNPMAPASAFYDTKQNMITPLLGGVSIVDMSGDTITRKGAFIPKQHDAESDDYSVQISYSFVDSDDNIVMPTSHGHIIMVETMDENGNIHQVFKKIFDLDVSAIAAECFGENIDKNLLSIVYDYDGNLWFVTGGFRIYPERNAPGFMGYVARDYINAVLNGETPDADEYVFMQKLDDDGEGIGEGAENGISSCENGVVILTNKNCYMLEANSEAENGINVKWQVAYESNGTNDAVKDSKYTGGGLSYGSGTTPTLTNDLVLFTDNCDPVNLIAISQETGKIVAQTPVLDELPEDTPVSVDNSILVYSAGDGTTSVLVYNWFGAGNAGLADPDADSSIQSYDNIYDANWMKYGNEYLAPGVERVDIVQDGDEYTAKKVWLRDDIRDTSMIKLSTATGYLYGYWQNLDTGMWCYEVLDFDTGETALEVPISDDPAYNNMAVGMIADVKGNALYCPTDAMYMMIWQDVFAYLPDGGELSTFDMERYHLTDTQLGGLDAASYLMKVDLGDAEPGTLAFRVNGLGKFLEDYELYWQDADGDLYPFTDEWTLCGVDGVELDDGRLDESAVYEIRFDFADDSEFLVDESVSVILTSQYQSF